MNVVHHPAVQGDVSRILRHYDNINDRLGDEFWAELNSFIQQAAANPRRFHLENQSRRRVNLKRFPYHFLFRKILSSILNTGSNDGKGEKKGFNAKAQRRKDAKKKPPTLRPCAFAFDSGVWLETCKCQSSLLTLKGVLIISCHGSGLCLAMAWTRRTGYDLAGRGHSPFPLRCQKNFDAN